MNRDEALTIVLAEAFAAKGIVMLAYECQDPGRQRMETLISALNFLASELSAEDHFDRRFVSALFTLATRVPEDLGQTNPTSSDARSSLYHELGNLIIAITELIENWDNWPDENEQENYVFPEPDGEDAIGSAVPEEFMGYRVGDISYCLIPNTDQIFPVRVVRLGFNLIEVEPMVADSYGTICPQFMEEESNHYFQAPPLPPAARLGVADERPVNSERASGPELRLLSTQYPTQTFQLIKERHVSDPARWPLPTSQVFERWFKGAASDGL